MTELARDQITKESENVIRDPETLRFMDQIPIPRRENKRLCSELSPIKEQRVIQTLSNKSTELLRSRPLQLTRESYSSYKLQCSQPSTN